MFWCASNEKYDLVKEIWSNIDPYIKMNSYWQIRFYWWKYIEKESKKSADIPNYVKALSEEASTLVSMGSDYIAEAKRVLNLALEFSKYSDRSVQDSLIETKGRVEIVF